MDDEVVNLDILAELLDRFDVIDVTSGEEALEVLAKEKIDLILLDILMPGMDGYEVCRTIKADKSLRHIPVIFITSKNDDLSIEHAYEIGASDYITKPFRHRELVARVGNALRIQELQEELRLLASIDPMTRLYNRRYFTTMADKILKLARREKNPLSLAILDIDRFKRINDTYGHLAGDRVITALSEKLMSRYRESDLLCRFGGEEFVILMPNTELDVAALLAERTRKEVEKLQVPYNGKTISMTVSIGVSQVDLENEETLDPVLKRADDALYIAKKQGRNQVHIAPVAAVE
ncbi:diguanylate cyclase [Nitratifractor sp.]|uniref:diguanylate cyclase n=1 Tax=Nitratifractor sp. TaxID=2268144 RepID=UPI0025E80A1B|nr:diguanylate cyclase [Nitratifractor sp.]